MGLAMKHERGCFLPILVCDTCQEPIADWKRAIAGVGLDKQEGISPANVYHKGECDPGRPGQRSKDVGGWQRLDNYLPWLLWNSGWGEKQGHTLVIEVPEPLNLL